MTLEVEKKQAEGRIGLGWGKEVGKSWMGALKDKLGAFIVFQKLEQCC